MSDDDLKDHIENQIILSQGEDGTVDIAEATRKWLEKQGVLQIVVDAIKGEYKDPKTGKVNAKDQLSVKDRINIALKLSNKMLPDLKATETKTKIDVNHNVKHTATQDLLVDAGCAGDPIDLVAQEVK